MNDFEYLIKQLNLIVGFLDVSDENVYNQIKQHDRFKLGITIEQLYNNSYDNYSNHITSSALLLGFAHFEDFLTKCIVKLFIAKPATNDLKVPLKTIIEKGETLINSLAEEQSKRLTFKDKINLINKHIIKGFDTELIEGIKFVNDIRNCLMHNNGLADTRLIPTYQEGQKIILTSGDINGYGLKARQFANEVWKKIDFA
jgi:hypothetical protein